MKSRPVPGLTAPLAMSVLQTPTRLHDHASSLPAGARVGHIEESAA